MELDKVIDSTALDNNLTNIANAIRTKAGTSDTMAFPDGFVEGINSISDGDEDPLVEQFRRVCTRGKNTPVTSLPEGITSIGSYAFYSCTNLALTSLPSGITSIGSYAFYSCTNLALTSLPSGITSIGGSAFSSCKNLALTSLPSGITSIGSYAFSSCTNLALTSLPSGITSIGDYAFKQTGIENITIPVSIAIPAQAFASCEELQSVTFTQTPKSIANNAFASCAKLTTINVPWAEGAVANAPWGATNATINYNYTGE